VAAGIAVIFGLSRLMPVTPYALNVTSLIGLGVAIDYSLFIVSRFREELAAGAEVERAVETAVATAGRAVAFSGLAVTIGLSGLVFYRGMFLDVIGIAAALVVLFAVLAALGPLPALLSLLGHRIDRWKLPRLALTGREEHWRRLGDAVMRHPLLVLVPVLAVLVAAGTPFMHIRTANSDVTVLPDETEARRGYEALAKDFPFRDPNPIVLVAKFPGDPRTMSRMVAIGRLSASLLDMPEVARVDGPVPMELLVDRVRALSLLANPPKDPPKEMQLLLEKTTGASIAVIAVKTKHGPIAPETRALLAELRTIGRVGDGELLVTGRTAADADLFEYVKSRTPRTVALVLGATFIVLLVALRSIALPIKAAFMNVVSIAASFGALVWVFQDGHLAGVLGFSPRPIEPVLPVLLFCLVFGLSMDYELLLLSRMQEEWRATADNRRAVIEGMAKTSQLITSAAAIMVVVFAAFAAARVVLIKAIGLGMALAVALDATVVRSLVVPATMRLLGDWNWWSPFAKRGDEVDRGDRSG
jgi:RND superfamily putative drug exporter